MTDNKITAEQVRAAFVDEGYGSSDEFDIWLDSVQDVAYDTGYWIGFDRGMDMAASDD